MCTELLSEKDRVLIDGADNSKSKENDTNTIQKEDLKLMSVKLKGQNKKRPPPMRFDITERICPSLVDVAEGELVMMNFIMILMTMRMQLCRCQW